MDALAAAIFLLVVGLRCGSFVVDDDCSACLSLESLPSCLAPFGLG